MRSDKRSVAAACLVLLSGCQAATDAPPAEDADFPILVTSKSDNGAVAATDGTTYLVVTESFDATAGTGTVAAQRLSTDGTLVGATIPLGSNYGDIGLPVYDGTRYLAIYQLGATPQNSDLYGQFISTSGVAQGAAFPITAVGNAPAVWDAAYGAGTFVVAYQRKEYDAALQDSVFLAYVRTVSSTGTVGPELNVNARGGRSAVAFDGTNFMVVYAANPDPAGRQLRGRFMSPAGVLGADVPISDAGTSVNTSMKVAFGGGNYLVTWGNRIAGDPSSDGNALFAQAVSPSGALVGSRTTLSLPSVRGQLTSVVQLPTGFLVTWVDGQPEHRTTMSQSFSSTGVSGGPAAVLAGPDDAFQSVVAYAQRPIGNSFLVLLNKQTPSTTENIDLYGRVLTATP